MGTTVNSKFIFDDELMINDDQESINGYLWAVDNLVDRLDSSKEMDNINFYANYNVKTGVINVSSSFYTFEENKEVNMVVDVELTDLEKEELILRLEEYCQKHYHSSCVDFVNEVRERCGLELLPVAGADSLADRISSADKIRNLQSEYSDSLQTEQMVVATIDEEEKVRSNNRVGVEELVRLAFEQKAKEMPKEQIDKSFNNFMTKFQNSDSPQHER